MCLIFIALRNHTKYKLVVAANRDEFYDRRTAAATFWTDHPSLLAGRDLEAMGTWLGTSRSGKVCMVTNFRDVKNLKANAPSRGKLVTDYLLGKLSAEEYLTKLEARASDYNGFSLIAGDTNSLYYLSNYRSGVIQLNSGLFGLSNHLLETPWPKVEKGKKEIQQILKQGTVEPKELFQVLSDRTIATDDQLPETGVGIAFERALSPAFIKSPGYGTRSSTVILADYEDNVSFHERVYHPETDTFSTRSFEYAVASSET